MNFLNDVITYVRRIVKTPSNASLTDSLIIDYINRFWIMDVDARMQLFDLKTKYQFQTVPGIDQYNMPLYSSQSSDSQSLISTYPVYQGFMTPTFVAGIQCPFYTERYAFWNVWPNYSQTLTPVATGDGSTTQFQFTLPFFPAIPGHIDMGGIIASGSTQDPIFSNTLVSVPPQNVYPAVYITYTAANGNNVVICDSGQFLQSGQATADDNYGDLYGLLMIQGKAGATNTSLGSYDTTHNTVNYNTGLVNVQLPTPPGDGETVSAQCYFFEQGIPRAILFNNNILTLRPPPDISYLVELDAYLSPAAFLSTSDALPFAYMAEYIARGAAQKILSDTGDVEQYQFYEPIFLKQEQLVWKRSQRQFTATRTGTIFSDLMGQNSSSGSNIGST